MGGKKHSDNKLESDANKNIDWRAKKKEQKKWKEEKLMKQFKRKREDDIERSAKKLKCVDKTSKGRDYTVSIALPGSILDNAQTLLLKTLLAGQVARAAAIYQIDEIVVFDDTDSLTEKGYDEVLNKKGKCCYQLLTFLQYQECPQYLRKSFFATQEELRHVGLLNPLVTPHHMRQMDDTPYREGVVVDKKVEKGQGSFADVGLAEQVQVDKQLKAGIRVTVKIDKNGKNITGRLVSASEPTKKEGIYWGYKTRIANNLTAVLTDPNMVTEDGSAGYDCLLGTSDKGDSVDTFDLPKFKHLLIVFGGLSGLEAALEADQSSEEIDPRKFFHHYINTCPTQGTRTIRTEEAIPITLCSLRPKIERVMTCTVQDNCC